MPTPQTTSKTTFVSRPSPLVNGAQTIYALLLDNPRKWGGELGTFGFLSYSFAWINGLLATYSGPDGQPYSASGEATATYHYGLNTLQQNAARQALAAWSNVANILFYEQSESSTQVGDIRFAWTSATEVSSSGANAVAWAYYPSTTNPNSGDVWLSTTFLDASSDWSVGTYNALVLMHEIGHALGLQHPFDGSYKLSAQQDVLNYTIMSYTPPVRSVWVEVSQDALGKYTRTIDTIVPSTPMVGDILAIQYLYGANTSYNTGDNVYTFDPLKPFYKTLWDAGGQDTISAAGFIQPCRINLTEGSYSSLGYKSNYDPYAAISWPTTIAINTLYDGTDNLAIAWGVVIENAIGGSGSDTLTGNAANNRLVGGAGNDTLNGGLGNDLLQGDAGNDSLTGGLGTDTAVYASKRSSYALTKTVTGWRVTDSQGSDGEDTLQGVERLNFADRQVALDLDANAGTVARVLGAVFGADTVLTRPNYVGIGLYYMDTLGYSAQALAALALSAQLGASATPEQVVTLLYTNVTHQAPSTEVRDTYVALLKAGTYTYASLTDMAALASQNATNIQLTGLSNTGLDYVTYTPST